MKHVVLGHNDQAVNQTLMQILNITVWIKLQQEILLVLFVNVLLVDEK